MEEDTGLSHSSLKCLLPGDELGTPTVLHARLTRMREQSTTRSNCYFRESAAEQLLVKRWVTEREEQWCGWANTSSNISTKLTTRLMGISSSPDCAFIWRKPHNKANGQENKWGPFGSGWEIPLPITSGIQQNHRPPGWEAPWGSSGPTFLGRSWPSPCPTESYKRPTPGTPPSPRGDYYNGWLSLCETFSSCVSSESSQE